MKAQRHVQGAHSNQRERENLDEPSCPICHGPVDRVHRRFVDRLISMFTPIHRYRCRSKGWGCDWEGNLPASLRRPY